MSAQEDKQALADLQAASADVAAKVADGITRLEALIANLQQGGSITAADLQPIIAQLKGVSTAITTEEAKEGA